MKERKKIVAVLDDLMFTVKISEAAKHAGFDVSFVKNEKDVYEKAKEKPALIILDLNTNSVPALKVAETLKSSEETKDVNVIAYLSHVQAELKQKAQELGIDMVLARSAFSTNLPQILKRYSGSY